MDMGTDKNDYQAQLLANRVQKNFRRLRKWARRNSVTAFRIYDRDIPEIPLSIDLYEFLPGDIKSRADAESFIKTQAEEESRNIPGAADARLKRTYLKVFLYERPYEKDAGEEERWLDRMKASLSECLKIDASRIVTKMRTHDKGGSQYSSHSEKSAGTFCGVVLENKCLFFIDLDTYLDTGLFLDMRPLRKTIQQTAAQKRVLNLFCYTSSFSLAAASGNASFIESVDLSNTYLDWSKKNFALNGFSGENHIFTRADCIKFLEERAAAKNAFPKKENGFDIIILDPPTFSNSKNTENTLDTNRDWPLLVQKSLCLLNKGGTLFFSTNSRGLKFSENEIPQGFKAKEITGQTIDPDFEEKKPHRVWTVSAV